MVRSEGLARELKVDPPTFRPSKCHFCDTGGHNAMEYNRKLVIDGETMYPLPYLFKKGLVTQWGLPTEKAKQRKGL